jgi:F-type H+-transporting ATPase subunit delta
VAATSQSSGAAAYAQALFEASEAQGGLPAAGQAGDALAGMAEAWRTDRRLRGFFLAGEVSKAEKQAALDRLAEWLPRLVSNFVRLLLRKGRLELLPDIADALTAMLHKRLHRVAVTLSTAVAMPPERIARWAESLKSATGMEPVVKNVVRPELVAGAVVRIGDTVADGSARRRLAELRRHIVERAVT